MLQRKRQQVQDEVETLNADVMRFMAILGLCLMLIFAAMEGVRVSSQVQQPQSQLQTEIQKQSMNEKILVAENKRLVASIAQVKQKLQQKEQQLSKQLSKNTSIQQELNKMQQQLVSSKQFIEKKNKALLKKQQKIVRSNNKYRKIKSENTQLQKTYWQTQSKLVSLESKLIVQKKTKIKLKLSNKSNIGNKVAIAYQLKPKQIMVENKIIEDRTVFDKKIKGFVLRFTNNQTFIKLLKQQRIKLIYTQLGKHYLVSHGEMISKQLLSGKIQMYQLNSDTVPIIYKNALSQSATERWGVVLPNNIKQSIQRLMQQYQNGILQITASGAVNRS